MRRIGCVLISATVRRCRLDELAKVEREVNALIRQNTAVETRIMTPDDARALGAQALFGEKYGDEVRVVSMGRQDGSGKGMDGDTYSLELCGGTHVRQLGRNRCLCHTWR